MLIPDKLTGRFKGELLDIFLTFKWTPFEDWGTYKYWAMKPNEDQYLGKENNIWFNTINIHVFNDNKTFAGDKIVSKKQTVSKACLW